MGRRLTAVFLCGYAASTASASDACNAELAIGLDLSGLSHYAAYNGFYDRGPRVHTVHEQPTFWQAIGSSGTCDAELQPGECEANTWIKLAAGSGSSAACLQACEAERTNGCCRFGPAATAVAGRSPAPDGCSLGHGRTFYDRSGSGLQPGIASCSGQAFIFYCEAAGSWNLAPPAAWDRVEQEACYNVDSGAYHWSVAIGTSGGPTSVTARLEDGFITEWGRNLPYATYVDARGDIRMRCAVEGENEDQEEANSTQAGPADQQLPSETQPPQSSTQPQSAPRPSPIPSADSDSDAETGIAGLSWPAVLGVGAVGGGAIVMMLVASGKLIARRRSAAAARNGTDSENIALGAAYATRGGSPSPAGSASLGTFVLGRPVGEAANAPDSRSGKADGLDSQSGNELRIHVSDVISTETPCKL